MKFSIFFFLIPTFLASHAFSQLPLKRYQYDEIYFGVTAPDAISLSEIAAYYKTTTEDLFAFNKRFEEDFDSANLYTGQPIRLKAGQLMHAPNLAFNSLSKFFQNIDAEEFGEGVFFGLDTALMDSIAVPITDTLAMILIDLDGDYEDTDGQWAYALGKYDLPKRHYAYSVLKKRSANDWHVDLLVFYYSDMVGRISVAGYRQDEDGVSLTHSLATDYDGDDEPDLIIESDSRNPDGWDYRSAFFTYELFLFQNGTLEQTRLKAPFEVLWKVFHGKKND